MMTFPRIRRAALVASTAATLLLVSCAAGSSTHTTFSGHEVATLPELKSLTAAQLQTMLAASAAQNLVPGAFAVVHTPDGTIDASVGSTNIGGNRPPEVDDVFRIGSVTKTMTGITILQLVDEGRLAVEDPIEKFIPGVPEGARITIANLLQMRSGLRNYLDTEGFASVFDVDMTEIWTPQELVGFGFEYPVAFAAGTAFDYSNTNTNLLGMVAEQLEGKPLAEIYRDRLFEPLGMDDTELPREDTFALPGPDVQGYQYGVFPINHRALLSEADRESARAGNLQPNVVTSQSSSWAWAAGGVTSTAEDLMVWAEALASGELLSEEMHQRWLSDVAPMDPERGENGPQYGLGIEQARFGANRIYLHEGELPGFNTFVATDPANGVSFVIWMNLALSVEGAPNAKAFASDLIGALYTTKLGTPVVEPS